MSKRIFTCWGKYKQQAVRYDRMSKTYVVRSGDAQVRYTENEIDSLITAILDVKRKKQEVHGRG